MKPPSGIRNNPPHRVLAWYNVGMKPFLTILIALALCVSASADTMHRVQARQAALKHKLRHNSRVTGVGIGIEGGLYVFANCPRGSHQFARFENTIPTTFQGVDVKIQCNAK